MTKTLRLHHSIVRELLSTFHGKEEATEGDSFLLSFREPRHALSFALSLHERLLTAKYEEELLRHPDGAPVWVNVSESFAARYRHGWMGDFQLSPTPSSTDQDPIEIQASIINTLDFMGKLHPQPASTTGLSHLQGHLTIAGHEALASQGSLDLGHTTNLKLFKMFSYAGEGSTRVASPLRKTVLAFRGLRVRVGIHTISTDQLSTVLPPPDSLERLKSIPKLLGSRSQTLDSRRLSQDLYSATSARNGSVSIKVDPAAAPGEIESSLSTSRPHRLRSTKTRRSSFIHLTGILRMAHAHDWHIAKVVCDSGHGGMTMISKSCFDKLDLSRGRAVAPPAASNASNASNSAKATATLHAGGLDAQSKAKVDQPLIPLPPALFLRLGAHCLKYDSSQQEQTSLELFTCLSPHLVQQIPFFSALRPNQWSNKTGSLQLRTQQRLELDVLEAPLGRVTIAFAQLVGVASLMAWDKQLTRQALDVFAAHAQQLSLETNGYIVEMTPSGLCLASFGSPLDAVCWAKSLSHALKVANWNATLLEHELCEVVQANQFLPFRKKEDSKYAKSSQKQNDKASALTSQDDQASDYLLRGPRLKIGIDNGLTSSEISPCTGRLIYRGRVMNRASRISSMAPSGSCWCSLKAWQEAEMLAGSSDALLSDYEVQGWEVGSMQLKGVAELMSVVQFIHRGSIGNNSNSQALAMHLVNQQSAGRLAVSVGTTLQPATLE
jgi:class 3 adenylate cyclase